MPGEQSRINGRLARNQGRPKLEATKFREALIAAIEEKAKPLADALVKRGLEGDIPALKEIADRALGRPHQSIDHTSAGKELPTPILAYSLAAPAEEPEEAVGDSAKVIEGKNE